MRLLLCLLVLVSSCLTTASAQAQEGPREVTEFFDGKTLKGWSDEEADMKYWSVVDGAIVGDSQGKTVPTNTFLWSDSPVGDFYLVCEVRLTPAKRNAGIQFRSTRADDGHALGYQADVGSGWWGKLYHEHGRGLLDDNAVGNQAVKPREWNRYEVLAIGDSVWTAVNGQLCTAIQDPKGERQGQIALQIHSGPPIKVEYRGLKLTDNPPRSLAGLDATALDKARRAPKK